LAAELARAGVTGPPDVFRGTYGFYSLYARDANGGDKLLQLMQDLGSRWYLPDAAFKLIPSCHYIHPFIEAVQQGVSSGVDWMQIENLHAWIPAEVTSIIADPWESRVHPSKPHDARWSLPYVLAAQLIDGRIGVELFTGECRADVIELAKRMSFEPWPESGFPDKFPARIRVSLRNGSAQEFFVADVKGGVGRPIESSDVIVKAKTNLRDAGWLETRIESFVHAIMNETDARPNELSEILRASNEYATNGKGK
jgi:2-methylcitrate dehydratase PrpD